MTSFAYTGRGEFVPGTGSTQPDEGYDITLADATGIDVLAGLGANLSNNKATHVRPAISMSDGATTALAPRGISVSAASTRQGFGATPPTATAPVPSGCTTVATETNANAYEARSRTL